MKGNSYIKLPKELQHRAKGLINLQNNDDKGFLKVTLSWMRMHQLFQSRLEKFSLEVNEETLGEKDSSIPLKEQERNGRNAGNAYISNILESIQYLLRMSLRDSVPLSVT